jgi:hypothetical protein
MRRLIALGAIALLALAVVPLTSAGTTLTTRHVDGTVIVVENASRIWFAKFEVRTTPAGDVQFGYLDLYGIRDTDVAGEIHEFAINHVDYYRTPSGAQGATLSLEECRMVPYPPDPAGPQCTTGDYTVSDGAAVGQPDTFLGFLDWTVESGNISIYSTPGQNGQ